MAENPAYLVFDIESVADASLVSKIHFGGKIAPEEAIRAFRDELLEKNDSDFIPYTFQMPVSVVIGKVAADFTLLDIAVLDEPNYRPHEITKKFWAGWTYYRQPTFVSFNGRGFDIPMLELAAFRYGIPIPAWLSLNAKSYEQPRNRYNIRSHLDLCDALTNFGASRFNGGLNLAATLIGKPGKMETQGYMVQDMYDEGRLAEINDYCRCDVLDTYFVFLRTMVLAGHLALHDEQVLVKKAKDWIVEHSENCPAYQQYLESWGDWKNPWEN